MRVRNGSRYRRTRISAVGPLPEVAPGNIGVGNCVRRRQSISHGGIAGMSRLFSFSNTKACPVVVRQKQGCLEILAFRHPIAGCQLVKGSIEAGEDAGRAALRELCQDAGINSFLGTIQVEPDQEWSAPCEKNVRER